MQEYALCVRPICPFLHPLRVTHLGLAWDRSPVASQRSYGGLYERSTCVQPGNEKNLKVLDTSPVVRRLWGFPALPWKGSVQTLRLWKGEIMPPYHRWPDGFIPMLDACPAPETAVGCAAFL